ncbi:MAG: autotransporter-associated beta strand repeat-containing protein [Verrucomicrobiota bacterium]
MAHLIPHRMRFQSALCLCPVVLLALAVLQPAAEAANLYWDFAPGTANGASNGGGTSLAPGTWLGTANWDNGASYQIWADGNDAFVSGNSALTLSAAVTVNTLNITSSTVRLQSDAAANNHILTLTNGSTIATGATLLLGGDLTNGAGNERSLDVRLGGDINTSGTIGGNLDIYGGTILSSTSTAARTIYANVRIGFAQGNTNGVVATFGNSTNTGTLRINGNLSTLGGGRRFDVVAGNIVEVSGNYHNAGTLTTAGGGTVKAGGVTSVGTITIGAASDATTLELTGDGVMTTTGTGSIAGTMTTNFAISSANATIVFNSTFASSVTSGVQTFSGIISGTGKVVQAGAGTLVLTNTNTYTGSTTVSGGVLQVGSAGVGTTGTGAVTVQNGGALLGTGTVRGSTFTAQSGSIVHAGDGSAATNFGTLRFTPSSGSGSFNFAAGSSTILGLNPGGTGDLLSFDGLSAGTLTFDGNLTITAPGYVPTSEETFNLLDWANLTSTFASRYTANSYNGYLLGNGDDNLGFDLPDIAGSGYGWDISQFIINGTISTVMLVPEPGRASLLLAGVCGLLLRRRRMVA